MPRDLLLAHALAIGLAIALALAFLPIVMAAAAATAIVVALAMFIVSPVLLLLLVAAPAVAADVRPAAAAAAVRPTAHWRPPVAGSPTRLFRLGPDPFVRGQHRGVDFAARGAVRAACGGRVIFAGRVAGEGTVSVRCGRWRVSYAPLTRVAVREAERVRAGARLGRSSRGIHFGVRRERQRFGYVDPLRFIAAGHAPSPPVLGRPPAARPSARPPNGPLPARPLAAGSHAASPPDHALAPWPVWLGLTLLLTGLFGAGRLRLPSRRQEGAHRAARRPLRVPLR